MICWFCKSPEDGALHYVYIYALYIYTNVYAYTQTHIHRSVEFISHMHIPMCTCKYENSFFLSYHCSIQSSKNRRHMIQGLSKNKCQ